MSFACQPQRAAAAENRSEVRGLLGRGLARWDELDDVGIDLDLAGVERRGNSIVSVQDPVTARVQDDIDRWQDGEAVDPGPDPLPAALPIETPERFQREEVDRKSTRLNSSHPSISYAVF